MVVPFTDGDIEIQDPSAGALEVGEFVVVGGEEGAAGDLVVEVFGNAPRNREAIKGGSAASDLIQNHKATRSRIVEDVRRFVHLDHEGGLTASEIVTCADTCKNAVREADAHGFGRDVAAGLG